MTAPDLSILAGYPPALVAQVQALLDAGRLLDSVRQRHPEPHAIRSDGALYDYVQDLKQRHLRSAPPLAKVAWDPSLRRAMQALGTHTRISRVQGGRLKAKREIRIASLFREAPADLLKMIVVHELAHLKEPAHDKAFYTLCTHMTADYHQLEFDARLWLLARDAEGAADPG